MFVNCRLLYTAIVEEHSHSYIVLRFIYWSLHVHNYGTCYMNVLPFFGSLCLRDSQILIITRDA